MTGNTPEKPASAAEKGGRWDSLRGVFVPSFTNLRVWLLQFFGGIVIALIIVGLLPTNETASQLMLQILVFVPTLVGWLTLDGGTFNYYLDQQRSQVSLLKPPFVRAFKHVLPLLILAGIFLLLFLWADRLDNYRYSAAGYLRSELPMWLRRHISEARIQNLYDLLVFFLQCIVLPAILLPFASLCGDLGFRGFIAFRTWAKMLGNRSLWGVLTVASILAVVVPGKLSDWKLNPETATLASEAVFLGFRMLLGYILIVAAWLMVCFMLARARLRAEATTSKT
jgi:energy-converting hydrogenase Eha subunit E